MSYMFLLIEMHDLGPDLPVFPNQYLINKQNNINKGTEIAKEYLVHFHLISPYTQ